MIKCVVGILLILASIWGGAYFFNMFPAGHWANFPVYITSCISFVSGCWLFVQGAQVRLV